MTLTENLDIIELYDYANDPLYFVMDKVKHSKYYYDYDRNDPDRPNPFQPPNQEFWEDDGFSLTGNPTASPDALTFNINAAMPISSMSDDTISFSSNDDHNMPPWGHSDMEALINREDPLTKNRFWKYDEDKTLKEVREYLSSTYSSHYTSQDSKTQTLDLVEAIGDAEPFCRSNAIKYLSRFGKKNGKSKQDILKAIHYCVLLYHFSGLHNEIKGTYETF